VTDVGVTRINVNIISLLEFDAVSASMYPQVYIFMEQKWKNSSCNRRGDAIGFSYCKSDASTDLHWASQCIKSTCFSA
jgi:hypothetical protein